METYSYALPSEGAPNSALPKVMQMFLLIEAAQAGVFLIFVWHYIRQGHRDPVYGWPFVGFPYGNDFGAFKIKFLNVHHLNFFDRTLGVFPYPAPTGAVYALFYAVPAHRYIFYVASTLCVFLLYEYWAAAALQARGLSRWAAAFWLAATTLLSYPFWFAYLGGNTELIVFLLVAGGLIAFLRKHAYVPAVLFGLAASMKLFPIIFFGLLLVRRQFRQIALGAATIVASTVVSLWVLCPSLSMAWMANMKDLRDFRDFYFFSWSMAAPAYDHSILGALRDFFAFFHFWLTPFWLRAYSLTGALLGILLFLTLIRKLPLVNQICALSIASIWFTPTSIDYTLLHLFVPIILLAMLSVEAWRGRRTVPGLTTALLLCAILIAPQNEVIIHHNGAGGVIKAAIMAALFVVTLRFSFRSADPASLLA